MQPSRACLTSVLPCQQWTWLCYWQGDPVSRGCSCHRILSHLVSVWVMNSPNFGWLGRSPELRLLGLPEWMQPYWAYLWSNGWCTTFGDSFLLAAATFLLQSITKFYLMARFEVFQRLIPLFPPREGGTSLYSCSHFNNTCAFCWEDGGVMCGKHWLANHLPVNNAYKCTIDRGVPVNSHCD